MNVPWKFRLALLVMVLIWGSTWAAIRIGLEAMPPFTGVALRFAAAGGLIALWLIWKRTPLPRDREFLLVCSLNGLFLFAGSYIVVYWCEERVPTSIAAVIFAVFPLFVSILAHWFVPNERLTLSALGAALVSFSGVAVIYSEDLAALLGADAARGALVMLLSPLFSAAATVAVKRLGGRYDTAALTCCSMWIGAAVTGLLALSLERGIPIVWSLRGGLAFAYLTLFGSVVSFALYFWTLKRFPAGSVALISFATPIVAVTIGALWFEEPFTPRMALGTTLVLGGVAYAVRSRH